MMQISRFWSSSSAQLTCASGKNTVRIMHREDGLKIRKIKIVSGASDCSFVPTCTGSTMSIVVPRFSSLHTAARETCPSAPQTFEATDGPDGNGHSLRFDRASKTFLDGGTHVFNISSRGGFTAIAVVRFTGPAGSGERVFDFGNGPGRSNVMLGRWNSASSNDLSFSVISSDGSLLQVRGVGAAPRPAPIVKDQWITIVARYDASTQSAELRVNNAVVGSATAAGLVPDIIVQNTFVGKSAENPEEHMLNGDVAGLIVVDEYLDLDLAGSLAGNITSGSCPSIWWWCSDSSGDSIQAPPLPCPAGSFEDNTRKCIGCPAGKFHPWPIKDCQLLSLCQCCGLPLLACVLACVVFFPTTTAPEPHALQAITWREAATTTGTRLAHRGGILVTALRGRAPTALRACAMSRGGNFPLQIPFVSISSSLKAICALNWRMYPCLIECNVTSKISQRGRKRAEQLGDGNKQQRIFCSSGWRIHSWMEL